MSDSLYRTIIQGDTRMTLTSTPTAGIEAGVGGLAGAVVQLHLPAGAPDVRDGGGGGQDQEPGRHPDGFRRLDRGYSLSEELGSSTHQNTSVSVNRSDGDIVTAPAMIACTYGRMC